MTSKGSPVKYEECPIFNLPEFITEHWDMPTLCAEFECKECALPEAKRHCDNAPCVFLVEKFCEPPSVDDIPF